MKRMISGMVRRVAGWLSWPVDYCRSFIRRRLVTPRQRFIAGGLAGLMLATLIIPLIIIEPAKAWWNSGWDYRIKITFNNSASAVNLTDFPIRISLNSGIVNYANTQNSGQDIRFVDANDTTVLDHEIEVWNEAGTSEVWVEVPQIDANSTTDFIYMYYGNDSTTDGQNVTDTWSSDYSIVYHMDEPSGDLSDSAGTAQNATRVGSTVAQATGKIGSAQDFSSTGYTSTSSPGLPTGDFTYEVWVYLDSNNDETIFIGPDSAAVSEARIYGSSSYVETTVDGTLVQSGAGLPTSSWRHLTMTRSGSTVTTYENGSQISTLTDGTTLDFSGCAMLMGVDTDSGCAGSLANYLDGRIDEFRVSNVHKSADWVEALYIAGNNAMASFGSEEAQEENPGGGGSTSENWWDTSWQYRRKITFNNAPSSGALANFPVRISLNSSNISYANTQNSGQDIRFIDSDGSTVLSHEIETWNESGTSEVWVRVPQIDAGSVTDNIWMYYGNTNATDNQNPAAVWDSNFRGVWHAKENPSITNCVSSKEVCDSTGNANNGDSMGTMTSGDQVSGKVNGSLDLDGTDDYISVPRTSSLNMTSAGYSVSGWVYSADATPNGGIAFMGALDDTATSWGVTFEDSTIWFYIDTTTSGYNGWDTGVAMTSGWHFVQGTYDGSQRRIYIDGVLKASSAYSGALDVSSSSAVLQIGRNPWTGTTGGQLDEIRVSSTGRSADWVMAEYRTMSNTMNTFGSEEAQSTVKDAWCSDATGGVICNDDWLYRRKVGFVNAGSTSNLSNFPVMIKLSAALGNIDYSKTQNSGQDIRFVDPSNASTVLPHEIENWNESGESFVWVKIPQVDANNNDYVWMYYGNASASSGQDVANVWSSNNYNAVWHLKETGNGTAGEYTESTGNVADTRGGTGSSSTTVPTPTAGRVYNGQDFDGSNDYINIPDDPDVEPANITVGLWTNFTSEANSGRSLISKRSSNAYAISQQIDVNTFTWMIRVAGTDRSVTYNYSSIMDGNWHYLAGTYDGSSVKFYVDGVLAGTVSASGAVTYGQDNHLVIGADAGPANTPDANTYYLGKIDETRIANTGRTADWIGAEYAAGNNTMATFGTEEDTTVEAPTLTAFVGEVSPTPTFQLRSADTINPSYLRYKIEVCSNSDCSTIVRTIDQTASQTGWTGQDTQTNTAYVASSTISGSTLGTHVYQAPALNSDVTYYWRGYAIDPSGSNTWSAPSAISSFTTTEVNSPPAVPTLIDPDNNSSAMVNPVFRLWTTDSSSDAVQYKIEVCSTSNCSSIIRTIDQTASQTGWSSQNALSLTAYTTGATLMSGSQQAYHVYQGPALAAETQYWWRAYAIDPSGSNTWSSASSIYTFNTNQSIVRIQGGTKIQGGTSIGN